MNQNNQKKKESENEIDFYIPVGAILVELEDRSNDLTRTTTESKEFTIVQFTSALLGRKED